jgi:hypothetical protein
MFEKPRFLYNNLITKEGQITVSSQAPGVVSGALKVGLGSASMEISAPVPTNQRTLKYVVQIHDVSAGNEIGQALYRWKDGTLPPDQWNASGITTHSTFLELNNGISIKWTGGTGNDFEQNDYWTMTAFAPRGKAKLIDWDRDTAYRSGGLDNPTTITINHGTAKQRTCLVIQDHNLSSGATITHMANSVNSWTSPPYSQVLTWNQEIIVYYFNNSYQYDRLEINDPSNPDGYIEIGELFIGTYLELSSGMSLQPKPRERVFTYGPFTRSTAGVPREGVLSRAREFTIVLPMLGEADWDGLLTMFKALRDTSTGKSQPFFFNVWSDLETQTYMVRLSQDGLLREIEFIEDYDISLTLEEVPRSRV